MFEKAWADFYFELGQEYPIIVLYSYDELTGGKMK